MKLLDLLLPKKKRKIDVKPDVSKEYTTDEIDKLIKERNDLDLKVRIALLTPYQRAKLMNIIKERRSGRNRKA